MKSAARQGLLEVVGPPSLFQSREIQVSHLDGATGLDTEGCSATTASRNRVKRSPIKGSSMSTNRVHPTMSIAGGDDLFFFDHPRDRVPGHSHFAGLASPAAGAEAKPRTTDRSL